MFLVKEVNYNDQRAGKIEYGIVVSGKMLIPGSESISQAVCYKYILNV